MANTAHSSGHEHGLGDIQTGTGRSPIAAQAVALLSVGSNPEVRSTPR